MNISNRKSHVAIATAARESVVASQTMLVACILHSIKAGPFEPADLVAAGYSEGSAKSLASQFNLGHRAAGILGERAAAEAITATADASDSRAYEAVIAQLRSVKDAAESAGITLSKGAAEKVPTLTIARKVAKVASVLATEKAEARKAAKGPSGPQAPTMDAIRAQLANVSSWRDVGMLALAFSHAVQELAADPERVEPCNAAKRAAASLSEATAPFRKK